MYPVATLHREYKNDCALGTFILPSGEPLKTIERPWLDNRNNVSCYPEGTYLVKWLERSASGKYRRVWHVLNVPGRLGILLHQGNLASHSQGCTIIGSQHGVLGGLPAVLGSKSGLNKMRRELGEKDFILVVTS